MPIVRAAATAAPHNEQTATFVNLRQLCLRITGLTPYRAKTYAVAGRIRTRVLAGEAPRYCLEDAQAVAAELMVANGSSSTVRA